MIKIGNNISEFSVYSCQPKTRGELKEIIDDRISKEGPDCDLNDIDTSLIDDMSYLFYKSEFNGDISEWDVSNVQNMDMMFYKSCFNGDISKWDTSKVENMNNMFSKSKFNGDISDWNVSNVKDMGWMFVDSGFNQDISNWKINKDCYTMRMFIKCPIKDEFKPKLLR